jgi:hypothetical protein
MQTEASKLHEIGLLREWHWNMDTSGAPMRMEMRHSRRHAEKYGRLWVGEGSSERLDAVQTVY